MAKERLRFRQRVTVGTLPRVTPSKGVSQLLSQFTQIMGDLNRQVQDRLDKRAVKKAATQGLIAGRDEQFQPIEGDTITIEAFNQAGLDTLANRLEIRSRKASRELFDKHSNDPTLLENALGEYRDGVIGEIPESLLEPFVLFWDNNTRPLMDSAVAESRRVSRNAHAATLDEVVGEKLAGAERMSFLTQDNLESESNITGERNDLFLKLISHGPPQAFKVAGQFYPADARRTGIVDPDQIVAKMEQFDRTVLMSRVMGKFDRARKAGEGAEFARDFIDNPIKGFSDAERTAMASKMTTGLSRDKAINLQVGDEEKAQIEIVKARQVGDLKRGVADGTSDEEDVEAAFPSLISGQERGQLLIAIDNRRKKKKDETDGIARVAFAIQAGIPMDAKSTEDRKAVDAYYKRQFGDAPPTAETLTNVVDFIRDVAVVPTTVRSGIRSLARSANPEQAVLAADLVARIQKAAPQVLDTMPQDEKAFSLMVSDNVAAGVESAVAVELARLRVYETPDSEMEQLRAVFKTKKFDKANTEALTEFIDDTFDPPFRLQPTAPPAMAGEYDDLVEQYFIRTRDEEVARRLAGQDLARVWGVSDTKDGKGRLQLMKFPPELVYGDGSKAPWMREQLEAEMREKAPDIKPESVFLITDDRTAREKNKTWQVWTTREDGMIVPVLDKDNRPGRWRPLFKTSPEGVALVKSREKSKAEAAAIHQDQIRILREGTVAEQLLGVPASALEARAREKRRKGG